MNGLVKEQLTAGILKQIQGSLVDEKSHEYNLLIAHQDERQCSFVATWVDKDDTIFALMSLQKYEIEQLQEIVEKGDDDLFESCIDEAMEKVFCWSLKISRKQMESANDYLTVCILYWIFNSYLVTEQTPPELRTNDLKAEAKNSFVFGFTNTDGYDTNVVIVFDEEFLNRVQNAMDEKNYDLLSKFMVLIKEHIVMLCTAQAEHGKSHWLLTTEIFEPPRLQILD